MNECCTSDKFVYYSKIVNSKSMDTYSTIIFVVIGWAVVLGIAFLISKLLPERKKETSKSVNHTVSNKETLSSAMSPRMLSLNEPICLQALSILRNNGIQAEQISDYWLSFVYQFKHYVLIGDKEDDSYFSIGIRWRNEGDQIDDNLLRNANIINTRFKAAKMSVGQDVTCLQVDYFVSPGSDLEFLIKRGLSLISGILFTLEHAADERDGMTGQTTSQEIANGPEEESSQEPRRSPRIGFTAECYQAVSDGTR